MPRPRMYVLYILGLRVCKQTRFCMEPPTSLSVLKSLSPLAFLKIGGADARSVQKTPAGTLKNERPCSFFSCEFAVRTRFCLEPPPSVALLNSVLPCTLFNVEFAEQTRCCSISRTSVSVLKSLSPLAFLKIDCPEVYIRVHFRTRVFAVQKHRC